MSSSGDVVTVDDSFADHLLSLGVAVELKISQPVKREPVEIEKKTLGLVSQPAPVLPVPTVKRRGRPPKVLSL